MHSTALNSLPQPTHTLSAAAVVVNGHNEILLVRSPRRGWEVPGGQVERGETPHQAAVREVLEESGIEVAILGFSGVFHNIGNDRSNCLFLASPTGGQLRTSAESVEVGWFKLPAALDMVTFPTFRQRIELCLNRSSWPFLVQCNPSAAVPGAA
ncbi:MAG: NUDIX hydrolase [Rhizobiaceae bacterium]|nr:NUDIX hydrolase [Rhizobiaceae bacterium]